MATQSTPGSPEPAIGARMAIGIVIALIPLSAALMALAWCTGVLEFLFAGFTFILYWSGIKTMDPAEFVPALVGALGGLGLAYLIHALPVVFGITGLVIALLGVALSVYLLIRGQVPVLINNAFMLFLTLGTSRAFKLDADFAVATGSIVLAALYAGGLMLLGRVLASRNKKGADAPSAR